jgi:hypothetical protein
MASLPWTHHGEPAMAEGKACRGIEPEALVVGTPMPELARHGDHRLSLLLR